ncbi:DEAD/DEAH box helicase [Motilimonas eburnea]|uniref:DEAD/DEAH box helicase n=1 Tax=Motilimonas eburnea TaxID=1737488 RepID=UPI001E49E5DD|nr:DEAD/DEAH box helicase [Motilimonas eburnea]MCE2572942.1 DEAD/DEAH box helicase [Motilimonas eburnea]
MPQADAHFSSLALMPALLSRLAELKYVKPTAIQSSIIPPALAGRDILAGANTGSGKTAAFALPILQRLANAKPNKAKASGNWVRALVLVPTRELAQQVSASFASYGQHLQPKMKVTCVQGGVSANTQMLALRGGSDVVVATPGRLLDLIANNALKLEQVEALVLDEADRLLSLGFAEELQALLRLMPSRKQTLLFSATFPEELTSLTEKLLTDPVSLQLQHQQQSTLEQRVITVNKNQKVALLSHLVKQNAWSQVLIFANAKKTCDRLAQKLEKAGIKAQVFHSDKGQGARNRILTGFKVGEIEVLIATDIAARGIDIDKLPVVINYELPRSPADYMHRIGRSGRAGAAGLALSLIAHDEYQHFKLIEKKNKFRLPREQYEGFEADAEAPAGCPSRLAKPAIPAPGMGKKKRKQAQSGHNSQSQNKVKGTTKRGKDPLAAAQAMVDDAWANWKNK